ncbi:MAG: hypothetical protein ACK5NG_05185, partial [Chthoniobacterales bacterium]
MLSFLRAPVQRKATTPEDTNVEIFRPTVQIQEWPELNGITLRYYGKLPEIFTAWKAFGYGWLPYSGFQPQLNFVMDEYPADIICSNPVEEFLKGLFRI